MKKNWLLLLGVAATAGLLVLGAHLIGNNRIQTALNRTHLLATACDIPGMACGGRLITPPVPCLGTGFLWAQILTAGADAEGITLNYVFLPTPFLFYLPTHVGQVFVAKTTGICNCTTSPHRGFTGPCSFFYGTSAV